MDTTLVLEETALDELRSELLGSVLAPGDAGLAALKRKYDPDNLFRNNNIEPV